MMVLGGKKTGSQRSSPLSGGNFPLCYHHHCIRDEASAIVHGGSVQSGEIGETDHQSQSEFYGSITGARARAPFEFGRRHRLQAMPPVQVDPPVERRSDDGLQCLTEG
ncbi:hypothetical protein RUM43_011053 [Polyplax serrata]|uniref:Uncharacterized protein n=1 Tax=Polyplax serrata TaxID=468196 RepID=A0AAN8PU59_POLSC